MPTIQQVACNRPAEPSALAHYAAITAVWVGQLLPLLANLDQFIKVSPTPPLSFFDDLVECGTCGGIQPRSFSTVTFFII